jgi:hypothetical protein
MGVCFDPQEAVTYSEQSGMFYGVLAGISIFLGVLTLLFQKRLK